jgi:hypothetical protein
MTTLFEQVRKVDNAKQQAALKDYWQLVRQIARDEEVDPDNVIAVYDAAGKSMEDLHRDVAKMEQRIADLKLVATRSAVESEIAALEELDLEIGSKIRAFKEWLDHAREDLNNRRVTANAKLFSVDDAQARLAGDADHFVDPQLIARERELGERRRELALKKQELEQTELSRRSHPRYSGTGSAEYAAAKVHRLQQRLAEPNSKYSAAERNSMKQQLQIAARKVELVEQQTLELTRQLVEVDAELADITQVKLTDRRKM